MAKTPRTTCRACDQPLTAEDATCPRCHVARKGDANRPMIVAYGFFLLLAIVLGAITVTYLRNVQHVQ